MIYLPQILIESNGMIQIYLIYDQFNRLFCMLWDRLSNSLHQQDLLHISSGIGELSPDPFAATFHQISFFISGVHRLKSTSNLLGALTDPISMTIVPKPKLSKCFSDRCLCSAYFCAISMTATLIYTTIGANVTPKTTLIRLKPD